MGNIDAGATSGATLLVDGRKPHLAAANTDGFFVGPTLFDHVSPENALSQTEIFGPVLAVDNVPTLDAAS
jgi:malonate-semialdehyde dehydrogenase (acetylating)/methylmalonate-semialdehyde dehydrogenase